MPEPKNSGATELITQKPVFHLASQQSPVSKLHSWGSLYCWGDLGAHSASQETSLPWGKMSPHAKKKKKNSIENRFF